MPTAVIVDVVRTPSGRGKPGGALSSVHPVDLAAGVLRSVLERNGLDSRQVNDVLLGCVSQVGDQAMNIARQAVLAAGFDETVPAATIDRQCGSSQQAAHFAAQGVMAGAYDIVIAGGVESMSRVPLGSSRAGGSRSHLLDERYPEGLINQGVSAELIAQKWGLSRDVLDAYSAESHRRAADAAAQGRFDSQLLPVPVGDGAVVASDETVREGTTIDGLRSLHPAFRTDELAARFPELDWRITPGNSSPLTDGASAALIMSEEKALELGLTPRARFHAFAVVGDDPLYMLTGPIPATRRILERSGLSIHDIDAYEVNEAFASVPLAWARELRADPDRLNPWGGAIALGHALGSSGTRLLGTLLAELEATGGRYGLQTMCEGGGMANATIIERL
ncbi:MULTISPECIES: thiolase family protein [unclassified Microbacterium]|uniref:thiolase family protein n=1 Tax=unclassified Microbacterium TaxID=2609290 RepID=UPI00214CA251|nr:MULTISPECIES: thiolase family protein [unclassified Microbacterium]MCR2808660.1 thiolase family protein [Microbacterium sp. zg.B185]WIM18907.1 thiolase family protein [Microbacterium sp. zg-B185]